MNRDFGAHFAAWFMIAIPLVLISGFRLKATEGWFAAAGSGPAIFFYSFVTILCVAFAGALIDVFIVPAILSRVRQRGDRRA
jgi:membrane protein YdbS with pleckstrin-like domain